MATANEVQKLYVAYFNRPADYLGLQYWLGQPASEAAKAFAASAEYASTYAGMDTGARVNAIYQNLFGHAADLPGLSYWTGQIQAGRLTIADVVVAVSNGAQGTDLAAFNAKVTAATAFTTALDTPAEALGYSGAAANAAAKAWLAGINTTAQATAAVVTAALDATVVTVVGAGQINGDVKTLSTNADNILGTNLNDTVRGAFGGTGDTVNAGDVVDGAGGTGDVLNLVANGTTASPASFSVKNVETINIADSYGATFNALSVENNPVVNFTNTLAGQTSTVTQASLGSTYGLNGAGNLTVDFANTTGAADTANVAINGAGVSTSARSTVNVSDGDTVEKVVINSTGTNFVTLTAGTKAANVTVTGAGVNNIDMGAGIATGAFTLDAAATTGANSFTLGTTLDSLDTIRGGSAATDSITATLTTGGALLTTMSGIETATYTYNAIVANNLANTTGLKTVNMSGLDGNAAVINADSALTNVNITTVDVGNAGVGANDLSLGYRTGVQGSLSLSLGTTDTTKDKDFQVGDITVSNVANFTLSTIGDKGHSASSITVNDALDSFNINVGAKTQLNVDGTEFKGDVGAINVTVGASGYYSGYFGGGSNGVNVGNVSLTVGQEGYGMFWLGVSGDHNIGNISVTANGDYASAYMEANTEHGNIGNLTLNALGVSAHAELGVEASGGNIGNITVNVAGRGADAELNVSAGNWEGAGSGSAPIVSVGNVNVTVDGSYANFSGYINVSGGNVGNVSMSVNGNGATGYLYLDVVGDLTGFSGDYWAGGGNIGNVAVSVNGVEASGYIGIQSSGGNIGNISLSATGFSADLNFNISAHQASQSGAPNFVTIGDVAIAINDGAIVSGSITADGGNIGNVTVNVNGRNSSGSVDLEASYASGTIGTASGYTGGGNIGNITVNINGGSDTEFELVAAASGGNVGNVSWTQVGKQASGSITVRASYFSGGTLEGRGGSIGNIVVVTGEETNFDAWFQGDVSIGNITATIGKNASASFDISGGWSTASDDPRAIGNINLTVGQGADLWFNVSGWGGDIGSTTITGGNGSNIEFYAQNVSGNVGGVTLTGGDTFASAYIEMDVYGAINFVDASNWNGQLQIDLDGSDFGTLIKTGKYQSYVDGTDQSDSIYLSAGKDTVQLNTGSTTDYVFSFAKALDKLDLDWSGTASDLKAAISANAAVTVGNGTIHRLVDISGGDDISTVTGFVAAVGSGEYTSVDFATSSTSFVLTAASSTATTFNVFQIDNDGTAAIASSEVKLIGVISGDAKLSDLTAAANFA